MLNDREKLKDLIESTIEQRFGTVCDTVRAFVTKKEISVIVGDILQKFVRTQGNYAIRTIHSHLDYNDITHKSEGD